MCDVMHALVEVGPIVRAAIVTDAFRRFEVSQDSLKLGLGYRPQDIRKWLVDVAAKREHHAGHRQYHHALGNHPACQLARETAVAG